MENECKECGLAISEYKQLTQQDSEVCEFCQMASLGLEEFPDQEVV